MPFEQKVTIWVLIGIAALSAFYSLSTGQLFPKKPDPVVYAEPPVVTPTGSSLENAISQLQGQLAHTSQNNTATISATPKPTRDPNREEICSVKSTNLTYTAYSKGPNLRVEFKNADKSGTVIMNKDTMYAWEEKSLAGAKFPLAGAKFDVNTVLGMLQDQAGKNGTHETCVAQSISTSKFVPPKTVVFTQLDAGMFSGF